MRNRQTAGQRGEEMTLISNIDGTLWKVKLDHSERTAEVIPLIEAFHSEIGTPALEAVHIIYFPVDGA